MDYLAFLCQDEKKIEHPKLNSWIRRPGPAFWYRGDDSKQHRKGFSKKKAQEGESRPPPLPIPRTLPHGRSPSHITDFASLPSGDGSGGAARRDVHQRRRLCWDPWGSGLWCFHPTRGVAGSMSVNVQMGSGGGTGGGAAGYVMCSEATSGWIRRGRCQSKEAPKGQANNKPRQGSLRATFEEASVL